MAGPYVHCLVSREALKNLYNDPSLERYRTITNPDENATYFPYVCLGSVSPDYPYPAIRIDGVNKTPDENGWTWGDKFHKEKTGNFIDIGIQALRSIPDKTDDVFLKKAAWLMGYYSHVITDLIIHAVVYKLVGGCYETHGSPHLHCEVVQDSWLFHDVYSNPTQELVDVHFLKILQKCQDASAIIDPFQPPTYVLDSGIEDLWHFILNQNYADFYVAEPPQIDDWHREYGFLMKVGTSVAARVIEPGMAYHKTIEIALDDTTKYYSNITLPDGTTGGYRDKVFDKAVSEVTRRLAVFLNALDTDAYSDLAAALRQWNIDKGTVDDQHPQFALWNGQTEWPFQCPGDPPSPKV